VGWRFRRSVKLAPGVRLNISKRGLSWTLGTRGNSLSIGTRGVRHNIGIPGTGLSYSQDLTPGTAGREHAAMKPCPSCVQDVQDAATVCTHGGRDRSGRTPAVMATWGSRWSWPLSRSPSSRRPAGEPSGALNLGGHIIDPYDPLHGSDGFSRHDRAFLNRPEELEALTRRSSR
jgi:hypothetical protein